MMRTFNMNLKLTTTDELCSSSVVLNFDLAIPESLASSWNLNDDIGSSSVNFPIKNNQLVYKKTMASILVPLNEGSTSSSRATGFPYVRTSAKNDYEMKCRVEIFTEQDQFGKITGNVGTTSIVKNFGELLNTQEFSDFTFIVSGKEFKVHKVIMGLASPYFATLVKSDFKENETNVLVNKEDPEMFQYMLEFIYKGKLPANLSEIAMKLYKMAHLYQIGTLMSYCLAHVKAHKIDKSSTLKIYKFASEYELADLFERSWAFIKM